MAQLLEHDRTEHAMMAAAWRRLARTDGSMVDLRESTDKMADGLRRHMELEEKEYLNPELLRDDVVSTDASGG